MRRLEEHMALAISVRIRGHIQRIPSYVSPSADYLLFLIVISIHIPDERGRRLVVTPWLYFRWSWPNFRVIRNCCRQSSHT